MPRFRVSFDNYTSRPIEADNRCDALVVAIQRRYPKCWSPSAYAYFHNGRSYIDIYKPERGKGSSSYLVASHVETTVEEVTK